jgi:hypothetical protein
MYCFNVNAIFISYLRLVILLLRAERHGIILIEKRRRDSEKFGNHCSIPFLSLLSSYVVPFSSVTTRNFVHVYRIQIKRHIFRQLHILQDGQLNLKTEYDSASICFAFVIKTIIWDLYKINILISRSTDLSTSPTTYFVWYIIVWDVETEFVSEFLNVGSRYKIPATWILLYKRQVIPPNYQSQSPF